MTIRHIIALGTLSMLALLFVLAVQLGGQSEPQQVSKRIPAIVKISDAGIPCSEYEEFSPKECRPVRGTARVVDGLKYADNGIPCSESTWSLPKECRPLRDSARVDRDAAEMNPLDQDLDLEVFPDNDRDTLADIDRRDRSNSTDRNGRGAYRPYDRNRGIW